MAALNSFLSEVQDRDARERALVLGGTGSMLAPAPAVLAAQAGSGAARGSSSSSSSGSGGGSPALTPLTPGLTLVTALATLSAELDRVYADALEAGDAQGAADARRYAAKVRRRRRAAPLLLLSSAQTSLHPPSTP